MPPAASLFNHAGAGHQHKINKNTASDTASLLFQTGFSGRAEFGTTGDDDWHVKVSADGSTWHEAIVVDKDTGDVGIQNAAATAPLDVTGRLRSSNYLLGTDLSLIPVVGGQTCITTWWGLQLVGNRQANVVYHPEPMPASKMMPAS